MPRPAQYPEWATNDVQDPLSQQWNVVEPSASKKSDGWFLGEKPNRQYWNWLQRNIFDWIVWFDSLFSRDITTGAAGIGLFPIDNALITICAVDLDDDTKIYQATGIKLPGAAPSFVPDSIISNGLSLGVGTITGDQPITGGSNVIVTSTSRSL